MGFMFILRYIVLITGLFMLPLLPLMMENCAECTYPVPEDISMGLMFAASNILGLGFIFALQVRPVRYVGGSSRQLLIVDGLIGRYGVVTPVVVTSHYCTLY